MVVKVQVLANAIAQAFDLALFLFAFVLGAWRTLTVPDIDFYTTTAVFKHLNQSVLIDHL